MAQIKITTEELASLIRLSAEKREVLSGALGGHIDSKESAWALPYLAEWRGLTLNDGAGI